MFLWSVKQVTRTEKEMYTQSNGFFMQKYFFSLKTKTTETKMQLCYSLILPYKHISKALVKHYDTSHIVNSKPPLIKLFASPSIFL